MDQSARDEARRKAQKWLIEEAQKTSWWIRARLQTSAFQFRKREMRLRTRVVLGSLALLALTLVLTLFVGPDRPTSEPPLNATPATASQVLVAPPSNAPPSGLQSLWAPCFFSRWSSCAEFFNAFLTRDTGIIIPIGFLIAFWVASYYVHWRQGRETVFKLVEEVMSPSFEDTRFWLISRVAKCDARDDLTRLDEWVPYPTASIEPGTNDPEAFKREHALARMVYFMHRVALYADDGLINKSLFRKTFHSFFAHYELVLLEFAEAYRRHVSKHGILDDRWLALPEGIERFFKLVGCAGRLPPGHRFTYFPSLNPKIHSDSQIS
jgi:hypothetical protein